MRISSIFSERVRQVLLFAVESASAVAAATRFCAYCRCVLITCICSALVFFFQWVLKQDLAVMPVDLLN